MFPTTTTTMTMTMTMTSTPVSCRLSGGFPVRGFLFALPWVAGLMMAAMPAQAQVYKCKVDGKVSYQAMPCSGEAEGALKPVQDDGVGRDVATLRKLWTGLESGMSVADVLKRVPGATAPSKVERMANGAVVLLEKDVQLAGTTFKGRYYFLDEGYLMFGLAPDAPAMRSNGAVRHLYGKLQQQLLKVLGKASDEVPLEERHGSLQGETNWRDAAGDEKAWVFVSHGNFGWSLLTAGYRPEGAPSFKASFPRKR